MVEAVDALLLLLLLLAVAVAVAVAVFGRPLLLLDDLARPVAAEADFAAAFLAVAALAAFFPFFPMMMVGVVTISRCDYGRGGEAGNLDVEFGR